METKVECYAEQTLVMLQPLPQSKNAEVFCCLAVVQMPQYWEGRGPSGVRIITLTSYTSLHQRINFS